jgi:bacillithiol biosynthesis cysteine-adding enzyme BshC
MNVCSEQHSYRETGKFSSLILDYIDEAPALRDFHHGWPSIDSVKVAITRRKGFSTDRPLLVQALEGQYASVVLSQKTHDQIDSLRRENTFTITTAHQCNIFLGPLYTIFKTLQAIRVADALNEKIPDCHFVPVFYLGSEDADLDELDHIHLFGETLKWRTGQRGAVGRMFVDQELIGLIEQQAQLLSAMPHGAEWMAYIRESYVPGITLADATFRLLHALFASRGLIVLQPDQPSLKAAMHELFWDELNNGRSAAAVVSTNDRLKKLGYSPQAFARPINLFYLTDGLRERIERLNEKWVLTHAGKTWEASDLKTELSDHPERFSPNVILRGIYQETILPNLLYVGGGGELAYWLQLKDVFDRYQVPFPLLQLRASVQWMDSGSSTRMRALGVTYPDLFLPVEKILDEGIDAKTRSLLDLSEQRSILERAYSEVSQQATGIDPTLVAHVESLRVRALKKIDDLERKMIRAARRKMSDRRTQIETLQRRIFPGNGLQERWENVGYYYAQYGTAYFDLLYNRMNPFGAEFIWLSE